MIIKIKKSAADALSSNKPPPAANSPDKSLFATAIDFPNGKRIWRTYPLPDRLTLNGYLLAGHFADKVKPDINVAEEVEALVEGLAGAQDEPFHQKGNLLGKFSLPVGPRDTRVFIEIRKFSQEGGLAFKMRMEFNPRKLGKHGCGLLVDTMQQAAMLHVERFLADAHVTRLDVAVDFADVRPADLIVTSKVKEREGQRVHFLGQDGALETVYLHRRKSKAGLGTLAAKVYDRNRERKAHGKPPPYKGRQVTRLEITKTHFPKGFGLANLDDLKNPLDGVRLSFADVLAGYSPLERWKSYLGLRLGVGHAEAVNRLGFGLIVGGILDKAFRDHPSNLMVNGVWGGWGAGLAASGVAHLIAVAKQGKAQEAAATLWSK